MRINLFILFILLQIASFAQYDIEDVKSDSTNKDRKFSAFELKEKIYVGADLSFRFRGSTYLYLGPLVGYHFTKTFSGGLSTMYQLYRDKYANGTVISESTYGAGIFLRYKPFDFLVLHSELDLFNVTDYTVALGDRVNVPAFLLGAGYCGSLGERAYYSAILYYDFIRDINMPLPPIFPPFPVYLKYGFVFYLG